MYFYEKILLSTCSSFARTNKIDPIWSAVSGLSILHVLNLLMIGSILGFRIDGIGKVEFVGIGTLLVGFLMWIHHQKFMKGKFFFAKASKLDSKTKFWYGLFSLIYSLATFGFFFWSLNAPLGPYILLCIVFVGVSLSGYLFETKN